MSTNITDNSQEIDETCNKKQKLDDSIKEAAESVVEKQIEDVVTPPQQVDSVEVQNTDNVGKSQQQTTTDDKGYDAQPLSKRKIKKLQKLADWEQQKKIKRLAEREKYRQKRKEAVAAGIPRLTPSRKELKRKRQDDSPNPYTVSIDLQFDDLMADRDICKCAKQLLWVYTINRKAAEPLHLHYTGLEENGRMLNILKKNDGYQNWDVKIHINSFLEQFDKTKIVYLTSDSDTVLTELSKDDVYIIGGLVDHNHHKGVSFERATTIGLRTARLPLSEHVKIKTRTVLTIVHVFDILLRVSMGQSWQEAILGVLPSRKGAIPLLDDDNDDKSNKECNENEEENMETLLVT